MKEEEANLRGSTDSNQFKQQYLSDNGHYASNERATNESPNDFPKYQQ